MAEPWPGANKFCLFYRLWQLTGHWEQGPNDTATQQISTSSASCSFEQIWCLLLKDTIRRPHLNNPPTRKPLPLSSHKTSRSGHSCFEEALPSPWAHPYPNCYDVSISGEQILPLAWEFNDRSFQGGCVLRLPALQQGQPTFCLTQQPDLRMGQGNSPGTAGVSKSNIPT